MFDWLGDIITGIGDAIGVAFDNTIGNIVDDIWNALLQWLYGAIYEAVADLFTGINDMGAEIFTLSWVSAVIELFILLGWSLYVAGMASIIFKMAVEISMLLHVFAATHRISEETLTDLRRMCIDDVKKINGTISLADAVKFQKG